MQVDGLLQEDPTTAAELAREYERVGLGGAWAIEVGHNPFVSLAVAAQSTEHIQLGTCVAVAFARNPMNVAHLAWDLQRLSGGRFVLGLGTQHKPHITTRFSMPWSRPAARMEDFIRALHAIWDAWQNGTWLNYRGEFYRHSLAFPAFCPPPLETDRPKVYLGASGPLMMRVAGRVADGIIAHPMATPKYLHEVMIPALRAGEAEAGRPPGSVEIVIHQMICVDVSDDIAAGAGARGEQGNNGNNGAPGANDRPVNEEMAGVDVYQFVRDVVRFQVAAHAAAAPNRGVLELYGWEERQTKLAALFGRGLIADVPAVVDDEMLQTFVACGTRTQVVDTLLSRFGDVTERMILTLVPPRGDLCGAWFDSLSIWKPLVDKALAAAEHRT